MKKIIALILTALMLVSVFAACGEKADGDVPEGCYPLKIPGRGFHMIASVRRQGRKAP